MEAKILYQLEGDIFTITLNNPAKLNCMGSDMMNGLKEALDMAEAESAKIIVIRGAGNRAFSTGADINEFKRLSKSGVKQWIESGNHLFNRIEKLKSATIALINGYAMGGGLELALCCDFRLATPTAVLCSPEVANGWLPGWGGLARLRRLIGEANAKKMVLLSERIGAADALNMGLLTKILDDGLENDQLMKFTGLLTKLNPDIYALAKSALMDTNKTTTGADIQFDVLAAQLALKGNLK